MQTRNRQVQPDKFFADKNARRPVTQEDKWCYRKLSLEEWGDIVTIQSLPTHNTNLTKLNAHIIRSKKCGREWQLQTVPYNSSNRTKIRVFVHSDIAERIISTVNNSSGLDRGSVLLNQVSQRASYYLGLVQRIVGVNSDFDTSPDFEYESNTNPAEIHEWYNYCSWTYVGTLLFLPTHKTGNFHATCFDHNDCLLQGFPCDKPLCYEIKVHERKIAIDPYVVQRIRGSDSQLGPAAIRKMLEVDPNFDFAHAPGIIRRMGKRDLDFIRWMLKADPDFVLKPYVIREITNVVNLRKADIPDAPRLNKYARIVNRRV